MHDSERTLTKANICKFLEEYADSVEKLGGSIEGKSGHPLLEALKREKVGVGPYPNVTLFEAANRIMTDLVILEGVKWLLENRIFPFSEYTVELGNEDNNGFDIRADNGREALIGEAFNVAPSFFQGKKSAMLKKLNKDESADYRLILANHDALSKDYKPRTVAAGLYYVIVSVSESSAYILPNKAMHATLGLKNGYSL